MSPETIARIAVTVGVVGFVTGFFALCGAISHGDHPVVKFLGMATALAVTVAILLGLSSPSSRSGRSRCVRA
ncbi:MAG TPA: hypothetical protein VMS11_04735 [Solirubrobacterales bacterium]|nr:hypothetical protein [Solirubrobacterales bacterium]